MTQIWYLVQLRGSLECLSVHISVYNINTIFLNFASPGIEYLCDNNLLQMDAQDVAHFLYKGEGLNKTAIGKLIDCQELLDKFSSVPFRSINQMLTFSYYRRLSGRKEWLQWTGFEGFRRIAWFYEPHFGASFKVNSIIQWEMSEFTNNYGDSDLLQTIFMVVSIAGWSSEDWSNDGVFCTALLSIESGHFHKHGYMLCTQFCHNHVKYITAQSIR